MKIILKYLKSISEGSKELRITFFSIFINFNAVIILYSQGRDEAALTSLLILFTLLGIYNILYSATSLTFLVATYKHKNQEKMQMYNNQDNAIMDSESSISNNSGNIECIIILQIPYNPFLKKIKKQQCIGTVSYASKSFIPERCEEMFNEAPVKAIQKFIETGFQSDFHLPSLNNKTDLKNTN